MDGKLSDNEKIYRGCVIGMIENLIDGLHNLRYDLESCPGIATDEEMTYIEDMREQLRKISDRSLSELKRYGLKEN